MEKTLVFPGHIKARRAFLGLSQMVLRSRAGVQAKLIGSLEEPVKAHVLIEEELRPVKSDPDRLAQKLASIAKVCVVLGLPWEDVVDEIQRELSPVQIVSHPEIERFVAAGKALNAWWNHVDSTLEEWREDNRTEPAGLPIRVAVLNWEPFSWRDEKKGTISKDCFFYEITENVLRLVDPYLRIDPQLFDSFEGMQTNLKSGPSAENGFQLAIGLLPTQTRREFYDVEFIPIPGLRVRLSCLTPKRYASQITWPRVWEAFGYSASDDRSLRVITTRGAVSHFLRRPAREIDSARGGTVVFAESLDPTELAKIFVREAETAKALTRRSVALIADETTATLVRQFLGPNGNTSKLEDPEDEIVEVGAESGLSFDMAFAAPATEPKWIERLDRAISTELFSGYAVETASVYAQIFSRSCQKNLVWKPLRDNSKVSAPYDFLRLRDFPQRTEVGERFFQTFCDEICSVSKQFRIPGALRHKLLPYSRRRERQLKKVFKFAKDARFELEALRKEVELLTKALRGY